jgi:hypothetical protein
MTKKQQNIFNGIVAYKTEQKEILDFINRNGGKITEKEFDEKFSDFVNEVQIDGTTICRMKSIGLKFIGEDDSFILGSFQQSGYWAKYLHLMQLMVIVGILKAKKIKDKMEYSINQKA